MNYLNNMTKEQLDIAQGFQAHIIQEIEEAVSSLRDIDKVGDRGHISLPATAASGEPVVAGANNAIYAIRQYHLRKLTLIRSMVDRETFEEKVPKEYW